MFPKNRGTPKSAILRRFSIVNHPFWGTPIFRNIHMKLLNQPKKNMVAWWVSRANDLLKRARESDCRKISDISGDRQGCTPGSQRGPPMGNPFSKPYVVGMAINYQSPRIPREHQLNTMGTLVGVRPIVP